MNVLVLFVVLILARAGSFVTFFPLFGRQQVPRLVKVGFTVGLAVFWISEFFPMENLDQTLFKPVEITRFGLGLLLVREVFLGAAFGYLFGLLLVPGQIAGEFITQELGLSFGNLVGTGDTLAGSPVTLLFDLIGTMLFFYLNVHHAMIELFHASFKAIPLGGAVLPVSFEHAVTGAQLVQEWGLVIIIPAALCLFLTTVVLALMARAVPAMNMYAVGFPTRLLVGMIILVILLPGLVYSLMAILQRTGELVLGII